MLYPEPDLLTIPEHMLSPFLDVLDLLCGDIFQFSLLCFVNCTCCMCLFFSLFFFCYDVFSVFSTYAFGCFFGMFLLYFGVGSLPQRHMLHVQELYGCWSVFVGGKSRCSLTNN